MRKAFSGGIFTAWTERHTTSRPAAVTKFAFDEEGEAQVSFYADSWGYTYFYEDGVPYMLDTYGYTDEIEAYSAVFKDSYLSEAGDKILLDAAAGKLTFNGTETEYAAGYGAYGAGLSFTAGGKEYSPDLYAQRRVCVRGRGVGSVCGL